MREFMEARMIQGGFLDLSIVFEGDVSADHVVEEDTEGPDGEAVGTVATVLDPLRRRVHAGSWK